MRDGLGNIRTVIDGSGNITESRLYSPYGEPYGTTGSSQTTYGYTGEPTDSTGFVHLRARYYNPTIGQFFNLDPQETANRFAYVMGNPVNGTDPTGNDWIDNWLRNNGGCTKCGGYANVGDIDCNTGNCHQYYCNCNGTWSDMGTGGVCGGQSACNGGNNTPGNNNGNNSGNNTPGNNGGSGSGSGGSLFDAINRAAEDARLKLKRNLAKNNSTQLSAVPPFFTEIDPNYQGGRVVMVWGASIYGTAGGIIYFEPNAPFIMLGGSGTVKFNAYGLFAGYGGAAISEYPTLTPNDHIRFFFSMPTEAPMMRATITASGNLQGEGLFGNTIIEDCKWNVNGQWDEGLSPTPMTDMGPITCRRTTKIPQTVPKMVPKSVTEKKSQQNEARVQQPVGVPGLAGAPAYATANNYNYNLNSGAPWSAESSPGYYDYGYGPAPVGPNTSAFNAASSYSAGSSAGGSYNIDPYNINNTAPLIGALITLIAAGITLAF